MSAMSDMDVTKPYEFIGFGAMDVTKPYKFIGFGAMDVTKPYKSSKQNGLPLNTTSKQLITTNPPLQHR